jgi:hypothetical protein
MARSKGKFVLHMGETDVSTPGAAFATFGADRGSLSCLNQHSASWLLLLLHVFGRKYLHTILLQLSFPMVYEFIIVYKIVLTCFAFKSLHIVLFYNIITNLH